MSNIRITDLRSVMSDPESGQPIEVSVHVDTDEAKVLVVFTHFEVDGSITSDIRKQTAILVSGGYDITDTPIDTDNEEQIDYLLYTMRDMTSVNHPQGWQYLPEEYERLGRTPPDGRT